MLLPTASFLLAALLPLALAKKKKLSSDVVVLAASSDPSNLSSGSMTTAQGCSQFYDVAAGDICQSVADKFNITLDVFYAMNPQIDYACQNPGIWIDSSYCVALSPTPASSSIQLAATSVVIAITVPSIAPVVAAPAPTGRSRRDQLLIIHAVLGSLAIVLVFPAAILVGRLLRSSNWFPLHAALNVIGASMITAAFAIGYTQVAAHGDSHFSDDHTRYGLLLFILLILQVLLGIVSHKIPYYPPSSLGRTRFPTLAGKGLIRLLHMALGVAVVGLGYFQITQGFEEYPLESDGGQSVPRVATIFLYVLGGLEAVAWLGGWVREAMGKNRPRGTPTSLSPEKGDRDYL